jgi:hypothetical protein
MHCVLWLSQLYHQRCVGVLFMGVWSRAPKGGVQLAKMVNCGPGQKWSDMNNMYGWLAGEHMSWRRKTSVDGSLCIFLSPRRITKEGAGNREGGGLGFDVASCMGFWIGFPRLALASFISQLVWSMLSKGRGGGFCESGPLAGNVCVIHTIPNSFFFS